MGDKWSDKVIDASEVSVLYEDNPGYWLLLDVLETGANGRASKFKLLAKSKDKEELYDYLFEDDDWDWNKKYIFVYSDPTKKCDLI